MWYVALFASLATKAQAAHTIVGATHIKDATLVVLAIFDTMLYWSLLKIPAQIVLITTTIPYAFALITVPHHQQYGNSTNRVKRWLRVAVPLFTILIVGLALLETLKMDAYSFAHLAIVVVGKTVLLCPTWITKGHHLFLTASPYLSSALSIHLTPLKTINDVLHHISTSLFGVNNPTTHYPNCLKTSLHLQTTTLLFLLDGISQWPKGWSCPARGCWGLAGDVLLVQGLMVVFRKKAELEAQEKNLNDQADTADRSLKNDHAQAVVNLGLVHCISSLLAITLVIVVPALIRPGSSAIVYDTSNSVYARYLGLITFAWTVLWLYTDCTNTVQTKLGPADAGLKVLLEEMKARSRFMDESRWFRKTLFVLAAVPLILATVKHELAGNTLVALVRQVDKLVSEIHPETLGADLSSS